MNTDAGANHNLLIVASGESVWNHTADCVAPSIGISAHLSYSLLGDNANECVAGSEKKHVMSSPPPKGLSGDAGSALPDKLTNQR